MEKQTEDQTEEQEQSNWYGDVDESTTSMIKNKGWTSVQTALESYRNLEKMTSGSTDVVAMPDWENEEQTNDFYKKMGRPDDVSGYDFKKNDADPDGKGFELFKQLSFEQGLTSKQAKSFYENAMAAGVELQKEQEEAFELSREAALADLKEHWGEKYEKNMDNANRAYKSLGIPEDKLNAMVAALGAGDSIKLFNHLGENSAEGDFISGKKAPENAESLQERIDSILNDPDYYDNKKNQPLLDKVENLYKKQANMMED